DAPGVPVGFEVDFGDEEALGVAVEEGLVFSGAGGGGFFFAYSRRCPTRECLLGRSRRRVRTSARGSTLGANGTANPSNKIINCDLRLYTPDTRSMALSNQFSMFSLTLAGF